MTILIKNANVYNCNKFMITDVYIENNKLFIASNIDLDADTIIDAYDLYMFPGFIDINNQELAQGYTKCINKDIFLDIKDINLKGSYYYINRDLLDYEIDILKDNNALIKITDLKLVDHNLEYIYWIKCDDDITYLKDIKNKYNISYTIDYSLLVANDEYLDIVDIIDKVSLYSFSFLYTKYVKAKLISLEHLINMISYNPANIIGIDGGYIDHNEVANLCIYNLKDTYKVNNVLYCGVCNLIINEGEITYRYNL